MKIQYRDYGAAANTVITSTVFEFCKHSQVVDAMLPCIPDIIVARTGMFFMKTALSGKFRDMLRAYKTVQ